MTYAFFNFLTFHLKLLYYIQHVNRLELTPEKGKLVAACNPHIRLFDLRSYNPHIPVNILLFDVVFVCLSFLLIEYMNDLDGVFVHIR